jgi:hypothetical protein
MGSQLAYVCGFDAEGQCKLAKCSDLGYLVELYGSCHDLLVHHYQQLNQHPPLLPAFPHPVLPFIQTEQLRRARRFQNYPFVLCAYFRHTAVEVAEVIARVVPVVSEKHYPLLLHQVNILEIP